MPSARILAAQLPQADPGRRAGDNTRTARLTQAENIRDITLFPRDLHRLGPQAGRQPFLGLIRGEVEQQDARADQP
jgi:hypothetical protein